MTDPQRSTSSAMANGARFNCRHCLGYYHGAFDHPTLGPVCPICLSAVSVPPVQRKPGRVKRRTTPAKMTTVVKRDGSTCWLCGLPVDMTLTGRTCKSAPSLDHVIPLSRRGSNRNENLRLAHIFCNLQRNKIGNPEDGLTTRQVAEARRLFGTKGVAS